MKRFSLKQKISYSILLLFIITLLIPTPYYIYQPGSVEELGSKVTVEGESHPTEGNFYLTTVLSMKAVNIYYLAYGYMNSYADIRKVEQVRGDLTDEEYSLMLNHYMTSSQQNAIVAGQRAANENVRVTPSGVFVANVLEESDAKNRIYVGDIIHEIDGQTVETAEQFIEYLSNKQLDDRVRIGVERNGENFTFEVKLIQLKNSKNKIGVGISTENQWNVQVDKEVKVDAKDIGGPSAGLMFSLQIYNQLKGEDLTKGYEIAGTGTIDMDGHVGQIGGIREKVTAVQRGNIDVFFVPKDINTYDSNEKDVLDEAKKRGYDLTIVPVATLQEAIDYLQTLPDKE